MINANTATIEHIKDRNKIFFSKETVAFHGDRKYAIEKEDGKVYLVVRYIAPNKKKGIAYYQVDEQTFKLNYTKLMES